MDSGNLFTPVGIVDGQRRPLDLELFVVPTVVGPFVRPRVQGEAWVATQVSRPARAGDQEDPQPAVGRVTVTGWTRGAPSSRSVAR